jgi:cell division protein FtsZ
MTILEAQKAAEIVGKNIDPSARIIWGCSIEPELKGTIKVLVIFTGARSPFMAGRGEEATLGKLGQKAPQGPPTSNKGTSRI